MFRVVQRIVRSDCSVTDGMRAIVAECERRRPDPDWQRFLALDFDADLARLRAWLQRASERPPAPELTGFWFGLTMPVGPAGEMLGDLELHADIYDPDGDWAGGHDWAPSVPDAGSAILADIYRIARRPDRPDPLAYDATDPLALGYAGLATRVLLGEPWAQRLLGDARGRVAVIGWSCGGDDLVVGTLRRDGFTPGPAPRSLLPKPPPKPNLSRDLRLGVRWFEMKAPVQPEQIGDTLFLGAKVVDRQRRPVDVRSFARGRRVSVEGLRFLKRTEGVPADLLFTYPDSVPVVRSAAADLLESVAADDLQRIPARIRGIDESFDVLNILTVRSCFDEKASRFSVHDGPEVAAHLRGKIAYFRELVLDETRIEGAEVFRMPERLQSIFVSAAVAEALAANDVSGVEFWPIASCKPPVP